MAAARAVPARHGRRPHWAVALGLAVFLTAGAVVAWTMLGPGPVEAPTSACTDHLGLPVSPDKCAELRE